MDQDSALGNFIKEVYMKMIGVLPDMYDFLYHWSQEPQLGSNAKNVTAMIMKARMLNLICEHQPDLLVFTHPFACCAAAYLRRTRQITLPLAAVMTDFASHQMWIHKEIDTYFVATHEMKTDLCDKGIANSHIFATGIPVSSKFAKNNRSHSLKRTLSHTVLIMGGGLGLGTVEKAVISLMSAKTKLEIIVVAGNNMKLKQRLALLKSDHLHALTIIGYTDRVNELMANSSILITKPGALTCSEALVMELPILLLSPIPGQEEDNADYLTRQGVALRIPQAASLPLVIDQLFAKPEIMAAMQANAHTLSRPNAAKDIATILLEKLDHHNAIFPAS